MTKNFKKPAVPFQVTYFLISYFYARLVEKSLACQTSDLYFDSEQLQKCTGLSATFAALAGDPQ